MAFLFDDALNEYLYNDYAVINAPPFTMACWFKTNDITAGQGLLTIGNNNSDVDYHILSVRADVAGDYVRAGTRSSAGYVCAESAAGVSADAWHHACGLWIADDERRVYLDGFNPGQNLTPRIPSGLNQTGIGCCYRKAPFLYMSGLVAEAAIWSAILSLRQIRALADGFSPVMVAPEGLVAYWPLIRRSIDRLGAHNLSSSGTSVAEHCHVLHRGQALARGEQGIKVPVLMQHYTKMRVA